MRSKHSLGCRWATPSNPQGEMKPTVSSSMVLLHYTYCYEADVTSKAHRSCPDSYQAAALAGNRTKVARQVLAAISRDGAGYLSLHYALVCIVMQLPQATPNC
jgi:hypothetical protein